MGRLSLIEVGHVPVHQGAKLALALALVLGLAHALPGQVRCGETLGAVRNGRCEADPGSGHVGRVVVVHARRTIDEDHSGDPVGMRPRIAERDHRTVTAPVQGQLLVAQILPQRFDVGDVVGNAVPIGAAWIGSTRPAGQKTNCSQPGRSAGAK